MRTTTKSKVEAIKASNSQILEWIEDTVNGSWGARVVFGTATACEVEFKYKLRSKDNGGLIQSMTQAELELNHFWEIIAGRRILGNAVITVLVNRANVGL